MLKEKKPAKNAKIAIHECFLAGTFYLMHIFMTSL